MKLIDYLERTSTSRHDFAKSIGVSKEAVRRYVDCGRVPTPEVLKEIIAATDGQVTANDFFDIAA